MEHLDLIYNLYDSALTALTLLHYCRSNGSKNFGVHHVQGSTMMVGEPTT